MLRVLARYPVMFSHIEHIAMAAEAPDLHQGDLGRLEEVRIALNGADIIGHKESKKIELLDCFALGVGRKGRQYFLLQ